MGLLRWLIASHTKIQRRGWGGGERERKTIELDLIPRSMLDANRV